MAVERDRAITAPERELYFGRGLNEDALFASIGLEPPGGG